MASIFTFDPDPPKISSPWSNTPVSTPRILPVDSANSQEVIFGGLRAPPPIPLAEYGIARLDAEPQEGPTEYKLHLLLRAGRSLAASTTGMHVSGSHHASTANPPFKPRPGNFAAGSSAPSDLKQCSPASLPSLQSRQNRLQHLTTQLLWRLQQSSPYHSSSAADLVLPQLPEATLELGVPPRPGRLIPGLEDSRGALYEIGVSDDGTFVGIVKSEMDESIINLQAMAASLGCRVEVMRAVVVASAQLSREPIGGVQATAKELRIEDLWVVEALVLPDTGVPAAGPAPLSPLTHSGIVSAHPKDGPASADEDSHTEQLRVSLTGSTTSGKSSLLGTLSTSTLDNGRGKSRLSLLKHRHEIASGVTSSVAHELIGYNALDEKNERSTRVINYSCGNVSSWNDIHNGAHRGRLVFFTDSAGHPRYRRTIVRGLISWAPHWTLCCVSVDQSEDSSMRYSSNDPTKGTIDAAGSVADRSKSHLELCLKFELPIVVVITKIDLTSMPMLRQTLSSVLTIVKAAGRRPIVLQPKNNDATHSLSPSEGDEHAVKELFKDTSQEMETIIPIVLTSAVDGRGIGKLHALLRHLPLVKPVDPFSRGSHTVHETPRVVFYIDEVHDKSEDVLVHSTTGTGHRARTLLVLSGILRYSSLSIGEAVLIGPFTPEAVDESKYSEIHRAISYPARLNDSPSPSLRMPRKSTQPRPRSGDFSGVSLSKAELAHHTQFQGEWLSVQVMSIRHLRLPIRKLLDGQVGSIGVEVGDNNAQAVSKIRKGMILARADLEDPPLACNTFKALFSDDDYLAMEPGCLFNIYIASIRACAKIITVEASEGYEDGNLLSNYISSNSMFDLDEEEKRARVNDIPVREQNTSTVERKKQIEVHFQFVSSREWVEVGARVLVMRSNGMEGNIGLEGFAGTVTEVL